MLTSQSSFAPQGVSMYTVQDANTGEFLFYDPWFEQFIWSRSRCTVKEDPATIHQYLQCATEGYPEVVEGRTLAIATVSFTLYQTF